MSATNSVPSVVPISTVDSPTDVSKPPRRSRFRAGSVARSVGTYLAALVLLGFIIGPFGWMLLTAVKPTADIFATPPVWWPSAFEGKHFATAVGGDLIPSFGNSVLVCVGTTVLCLGLALLAGYSLSRSRLRGRSSILGAVLVTQFLPHAVLLLPIYQLANDAGLLNSRWGLMVAMLSFNLPAAMWLLRGFIGAVPVQLEEAARIDGLTEFQAYWRVTVPLSIQGVLAVGVYVFFTSWQDFMFAMVFLSDPRLETTPLALLGFIGQHSVDWGLLMAASTVMMVPVVLMFSVVQRSFVGGLTTGAVKG